ncbi:MAG: hypothetical protein LBI20_02630 [Holosporales bacterium]|jgi:F0F1-type ATP synthase epsilon subunit|nr:hypothetical protein [Holosporales bacterium]
MFAFTLICDEKEIFDGQVSKVLIETNSGPIEILPHHQPYMARIRNIISYSLEEEEDAQICAGIIDGFLYTNGSRCIAIVDHDPK